MAGEEAMCSVRICRAGRPGGGARARIQPCCPSHTTPNHSPVVVNEVTRVSLYRGRTVGETRGIGSAITVVSGGAAGRDREQRAGTRL